ncbi:MAG: protease complex subunit PrcB family protein [Tissierellaceae bacterium]
MQWVEKNKKNEGIYKREEQDKTIYMIAAGEKPNMGYAVSVNKTYKDNKGNVVIEYEMKQPGLGERVMQAFSYPYVLFFMDNQETAIFKEQKSIKE